eukprot:1469832-Rhodomonas_salina.2
MNDDGHKPEFLRLRGRFFCRDKARIGLAVCRAAGARGEIAGVPYAVTVHASGLVPTSDLDFGEDLPAWTQAMAA